MKEDPETFRDRVLERVAAVPEGRVSTYGDIAALVGVPRAARGVGFVLGSLPDDSIIPWWRIVNRAGGISVRHMGGRIQRVLLEKEGVAFGDDDRVELSRYRWVPEGPPIDVLPRSDGGHEGINRSIAPSASPCPVTQS